MAETSEVNSYDRIPPSASARRQGLRQGIEHARPPYAGEICGSDKKRNEELDCGHRRDGRCRNTEYAIGHPQSEGGRWLSFSQMMLLNSNKAGNCHPIASAEIRVLGSKRWPAGYHSGYTSMI